MSGEVQFFTHDGHSVGYRTLGDDGPALLVVPNWFTNAEMYTERTGDADFTRRLAAFCRWAVYDQPGTGLSDDLPADADLGMERWFGVLDAAIDELGWERTSLLANDLAAMVACSYAARRPERVTSLILNSPLAGFGRYTPEQRSELVEESARMYTSPENVTRLVPSLAGDAEFASNWRKWALLSNRPGAVRRYFRAVYELEAHDVLPNVRCPTLVLHAVGNAVISLRYVRRIAEAIPDASLVELATSDIVPVRPEDIERAVAEIRRFLLGEPYAAAQLDRVLTTVLFTDIVSSTARTAEVGDKRWRTLLDRHDEIVRDVLHRFGGRLVKSTGDGILATFESPARSIRCAQTMREALRAVGVDVRAGLHTGEIEVRGKDIGGMAANIARRVCDSALAGEVRVSESVVLVVAGSGLKFEELGPRELSGVPGSWRLSRATD